MPGHIPTLPSTTFRQSLPDQCWYKWTLPQNDCATSSCSILSDLDLTLHLVTSIIPNRGSGTALVVVTLIVDRCSF